MNNRLNKKKIYFNRSLEVSKTECETPEYMKKQKLDDKEIIKIKKALLVWEEQNIKICTCEKMRCAYCGGKSTCS